MGVFTISKESTAPSVPLTGDVNLYPDANGVLQVQKSDGSLTALGTGGGGGGFTVASQAEAEAGTENTKGMTPLRTKQAITVATDVLKGGVVTNGDSLAKLYALIQALNAIVGGTTADGDSVVNTVNEVLAVMATYPEGVDVLTNLNSRLLKTDVVNNLTQVATGKALDASQAPVIVGLINSLTTTVNGKATPADIATAISALVNTAPSTLDTLKELSDALGADPNFATTMANALGLKAPLASPVFTGTPAGPTAAPGANTTQLATTAFVKAAVDAGVAGAGGFSVASQVEAETGTDNAKGMTPLRTKQAITVATDALKGGVSSTGDTLAKLLTLIQGLQAIVGGTAPDGDTVVNTVTELLAVFSAYSEVVDIANLISSKAPLASPALSGTPTAPTAAPGTSNTQVASTAFVAAAVAAGGGGSTVSNVTIITGASSTLADSSSNTIWVLFNPSAALASHAVTLPVNPGANQLVVFSFGGAILAGPVVNAFSFTNDVIQATTPGSVEAGEKISVRFNPTTSKWYRND